MAKTNLSFTRKLLKGSGLGAVAAALVAMAIPQAVLAQDGRGRGNGAQAAQPRSGGGSWNGNRAPRASQPQWNRNSSPTPQRSVRSARPADSQANRANRNSSGRDSAGSRNVAQPSTTISGGYAIRNSARDAQVQRNAAERNRTYANPDRNRTYRQGARDGQRVDNRQDRRNERQADRWRNNDNRWNNNGRWNNGNSGRWDNDGRRWTDNNHRTWNRNWRGDNRYDWQRYRNSNRNIYRLGHYYAPYRNYSYRRVGIGFQLDSMFFGSNYWINDPWYYRLPAAYGSYRWVRYFDDALLVDTYTGEVVDVIEDFFW